MTQFIRLALRVVVLLVLIPLLSAATCAAAKPVVRTVIDIARSYCVLFNSEQKTGLSLQEIEDTLCASEAQIRPYLDVLLKGKQGLKAGAQGASGDAAVPEAGVTDATPATPVAR